jgi:ActR/RegA family two-component response regulator
MLPEPRVLIIEDHDALRVMLFTILRHQPLGVDTAATVEEALEKVAVCDYALILIAVRDPNGDSFADASVVSAILTKPLEVDTLGEVVRECALVVPPPDDPLPCPAPAESDVRSMLDRGSYAQN